VDKNDDLRSPEDFRGKRVTVMGLGLFGGGVGATRFLVEHGAHVTVTDKRSPADLAESLEQIKGLPVELVLGRHREQDFTKADLVIVNPAVPKASPYIRLAQQHGVRLDMEMNLFFRFCAATIVGITGSNGKSTTTCLTYEILKACGHRAWLGGNIGRSLLADVHDIRPTDIVVLELSSFQLEDLHRLSRSPHISIVVNITPNHLDRHETMENYIGAKQSIMRYQSERDFLILNHEDPTLRRWAAESGARVYFFSAVTELNEGAFVCDQELHVRDGRAPVRVALDRVQLPGRHNLENIAAASMAAYIAGAGADQIDSTVSSFQGLEHRLEFVTDVNGVRYYNDSIATTPESAIAALRSFKCGRVLVAGGSEKGVSFDAFCAEAAHSAKSIILIGKSADKLERLITAHRGPSATPPIHRAGSLREAVACAARESAPGDVVLLSPACASFDMFRNFAERGRQFKTLVRELKARSKRSV